ncbi:hypothetical protein ACI8AF_03035 [Blastococcus sp. SYSU D00669]
MGRCARCGSTSGWRPATTRTRAEHLGFDEYDVVTQIVRSHHYRLADGRAEVLSAPFRYVWPAELDLMAQLAGLEPEHRWADWGRSPFGADSTAHVSVWRKP